MLPATSWFWCSLELPGTPHCSLSHMPFHFLILTLAAPSMLVNDALQYNMQRTPQLRNDTVMENTHNVSSSSTRGSWPGAFPRETSHRGQEVLAHAEDNALEVQEVARGRPRRSECPRTTGGGLPCAKRCDETCATAQWSRCHGKTHSPRCIGKQLGHQRHPPQPVGQRTWTSGKTIARTERATSQHGHS